MAGASMKGAAPGDWVYSPGGTLLAETDTSGNTVNEYIFFDGMRLARRDSSGNVYYYFGNSLSSATITTASGGVCYDADFYPFGGELAFTNTCSQNYKFAGMERDSATGLDHTQFRQYSSNLGRWLSPDPSGMAAVSLTNPQSWNMYAYVTSNPTNLIDPLGLGGYGPGSNTCTSTTDNSHNGQSQCQAATYAAAMAASSSLPAGCSDAMEYGCGGTPSELALGEQAEENQAMAGWLRMQGYQAQVQNGQIEVYSPASTVTSVDSFGNTTSTTEPGQWLTADQLPSQLQWEIELGTAGNLAAPAVNDAAIGTAALIFLPYTMTGVAEVGTAAAASPYLQYQAVQFSVSFTSTVVNGPTHLPSDWTSPGAWVGWAAGSWAWWEQ